jgi:hypothetical protein
MRRGVLALLLPLTICVLVAENVLYFPLSVPYMKDLASGAPLLDMRLGYSPAAAYHLLDVLRQPGREAYLRLLWTIDLVLPALFGASLAFAIRQGTFRRWLSIPLVAAMCDYAENIAITILLLRYPAQQPGFARLASVFTITKLVLYTSGLLLAIGGYRRTSTR